MENEKLDFFDASRIVAGTERRVRDKDGAWWKWLQEPGRAAVLVDDNEPRVSWWPTVEQQKEKCWQVEPEKPKEVFVWGVCEEDGQSWLFSECPQKEKNTDKWVLPKSEISIPLKSDLPLNLFSKDEPTKYRLIPADETWPWRKFDPAKILDEKWYLVLWDNGCISKAFYSCQGKDSAGFACRENSNLNSESIQAYIPIEEIPKPELNDA